MKNILLLFAVCISLSACGQSTKTNMEKYKYNYKNDKRTVYGFDLTIPGAYELYINDIRARKDKGTGMHNTFIPINPNVLKSGTYSFRLKLYPLPSDIKDHGGIAPSTLSFLKVAIGSYEKVGGREQVKSYKIIEQFPITKIEAPVPYYEVTGEFTVDLPYELEGWSNGQDLSKMDSVELEKKVVGFYNRVRDLLHNGNYQAFLDLVQKRSLENYIYDYYSKNDIEKSKMIEIENLIDCQNMMAPIEDYELKFYGNGKLVRLERKPTNSFNNNPDVNIEGWSALIRLREDSGANGYGLVLYLPEGSDEFVIIRK